MSTITPPVRVRAMAEWPESPHLSLSRRQNLSLCPTLVVKMRRPENRYVGLRGGKNDISTIFWFKWNGFICVYPLRLKLKIIVKSKLIEVLLRFLKIFLFKKFTSLIFFLEVLKESASFSAACGWYLFFILHNYRLYPQ